MTGGVQEVVEEFPLLMPKVKPDHAESYLCTPIRLDTDATYSVVGFRPNATKMTAHHMLVYGCSEPGQAPELCWLNCTVTRNTKDWERSLRTSL